MHRSSAGQAKRQALSFTRSLPDTATATTQDILAELFFKEQIDAGLRDVASGRVLSHGQLKERMARWRKSAGR